ncbi:MAG TPA: glycerophosphodiester phosphodiesterase, partial [Parabacteroides goldsteinii]|nr:glycerophosphodiester phosphodiesterase [Parabacteroides goldsteinii]
MKKRSMFAMLLVLFLCASSVYSQTKVIAHRGYWDCEGSAQNSVTALNKAHEVGAYGSEFDVSITADGIPVVNHDDSIQGFCIETSLYEQLKDLKLKNGETLPTLEEYLIQGKKNQGTQLILEIKPHKRVVNEDKAVATILYLVQKYQMEDQVEYISFSMNICKELIRRAPSAQVSYLRGEVSPADLKVLGFSGLDYHYKVFDK